MDNTHRRGSLDSPYRVLCTGFEPFGGHKTNVSKECVSQLSSRTDAIQPLHSLGEGFKPPTPIHVEWSTSVLTVDEDGSKDVALRLKAGERWDAIIHLGLAESSNRPRIETTAYNSFAMRMADNSGRLIEEGSITKSAPSQIISNAEINRRPIGLFGDRLELSSDPGRFVCNETYWRTLWQLNTIPIDEMATPAVFLHLPPANTHSTENSLEIIRQMAAMLVSEKRVIVAAGLVSNEAGEILGCLRGEDEPFSGWWELPGGKLDLGETIHECLARELFEELGIEVEVGTYVTTVTHRYDEGDLNIEMHAYRCRMKKEADEFELNAHSEVRWLALHELKAMEWLAADRPLIDFIVRDNHP